MKFLVVSQYYYPENFRINDFVAALLSRGHEVDVLTGLPNYPSGNIFEGYSLLKGPFQEISGEHAILRVPLIPRGKKKGVQLLLNYISFALLGSILGPFILRNRQYDQIFVYEVSPITVALPAILLRYLKKIKMTMWVTDLWPESLTATGAVSNRWIIKIIETLVRFIYRHTDKILVSSRSFIPSVKRYTNKEPIYFPQWAESFYLSPVSASEMPEFEIPKGFRLMFAGNIGTSQSFETLIDAAVLLKDYTDIHWVILGDGLGKDDAVRRVQDNSLENTFHFLGSRPVCDMPKYYACADGLLVSLKSTPLFEITIPGKLQSCLASGRPVIGSIDGEAANIIREAGGFVAKAGNAEQLAEQVLKLYQMNRNEREEMGKIGREYFLNNFERESLVDRAIQLMEN